ncbi:hypothetical protein [Mesorhizobium sp. WSM3873]|uniref:hypothetical protein n=1 Tax=Mesorhizobium sp. WSM3873 TaxID=1854056 RepID=UPI0012E9D43F|nr:hypothetical protein [Mesorhizobium sp. WSM3873]
MKIAFATILVLGIMGGSLQRGQAAEDSPEAKSLRQEWKFIAINDDFRNRYIGSGNSLLRNKFISERAKQLREIIPTGHITGWVGRVDHINDAGGGYGSIAVSVDENIQVGTADTLLQEPSQWIDSMTSDLGGGAEKAVEGSLIDPKSQLYQKLLALRVGQTIEFSGSFYPTNDGGIVDSNILEENSVVKPFYKFKFESISEKQQS